MTKDRKDKLKEALRAYTSNATSNVEAAKAALVDEGIYLPDGALAPEYVSSNSN